MAKSGSESAKTTFCHKTSGTILAVFFRKLLSVNSHAVEEDNQILEENKEEKRNLTWILKRDKKQNLSSMEATPLVKCNPRALSPYILFRHKARGTCSQPEGRKVDVAEVFAQKHFHQHRLTLLNCVSSSTARLKLSVWLNLGIWGFFVFWLISELMTHKMKKKIYWNCVLHYWNSISVLCFTNAASKSQHLRYIPYFCSTFLTSVMCFYVK